MWIILSYFCILLGLLPQYSYLFCLWRYSPRKVYHEIIICLSDCGPTHNFKGVYIILKSNTSVTITIQYIELCCPLIWGGHNLYVTILFSQRSLMNKNLYIYKAALDIRNDPCLGQWSWYSSFWWALSWRFIVQHGVMPSSHISKANRNKSNKNVHWICLIFKIFPLT